MSSGRKTGRICRGLLFAMVLGSVPAWAVDVALRLEGGASVPVSAPQSDLYTLGPAVVGTLELGLSGAFDIVLQGGWLRQAPKVASAPGGTSVAVGLGIRAKTLFSDEGTLGWLEGVGHFNQTGDVAIASASGALGVTWRVGTAWGVGPYVRVTHIFAPPAPAGFSAFAATLVSGGLSLELGNTSPVPPPPLPPPPPPPLPEPKRVEPPPPPADADHDGVVGDADKCPNEPEDRDGFEDSDGCPETDNDGDGVLDGDDACPMMKGSAATRGCPDGDGDGVADDADECRTKPGPASNAGCPTYKQVKVTESKLEIDQKIFFAFGKTTIMPKSFPLLDEVGQALKDRTRMCVRVEGHTDSVGNAAQNRLLSDGRAAAVKTYLIMQGIKDSRLTSKGYGPDLPMETNATPEGRERNRRVEFVIIQCPEVTP